MFYEVKSPKNLMWILGFLAQRLSPTVKKKNSPVSRGRSPVFIEEKILSLGTPLPPVRNLGSNLRATVNQGVAGTLLMNGKSTRRRVEI